MRISLRTAALLVGAALSIGTVASVVAQEPPPSDEPPAAGEQAPREGKRFGHRGPGGPGLIRSESVFEGAEGEGVRTVLHDRGTIASVEGSTINVSQADGASVAVSVTEDTRIVRDGEQASVSDLQAGDHVKIVRSGTAGETPSAVMVHAISAERYEQMQAEREARREACEADPTQCRRGGPGHGRRGPGGPPAAEPATA